jgi:hypothetical protein
VALLLAALAVAAASASQSPESGVTDTTIVIGVEAPVSSLSLDGENLGFRLAFEEVNAAGGVPAQERRSRGCPRRRAPDDG